MWRAAPRQSVDIQSPEAVGYHEMTGDGTVVDRLPSHSQAIVSASIASDWFAAQIRGQPRSAFTGGADTAGTS
jgi:hypothetical protein